MYMRILIIIIFLSGCVSFQKAELPNSSPKAEMSYLAGSFFHSYRESFFRMSIELKNLTTKETFLIDLKLEGDYKGLEIFPFPKGRYQLINLVETDAMGGIRTRFKITDPELSKPFDIMPNQIQYIGHYDGKNTNRVASAVPLFIGVSFQMSRGYSFSAHNSYQNDIEENISNKYPYWDSMPIKTIFNLPTINTGVTKA